VGALRAAHRSLSHRSLSHRSLMRGPAAYHSPLYITLRGAGCSALMRSCLTHTASPPGPTPKTD